MISYKPIFLNSEQEAQNLSPTAAPPPPKKKLFDM